ncbi:MAG: glycosyltransferase [Gammaproteobacteria bacterium]|jgi:exo-beta-1,3-glucanase (GH17 family)/cellulose synthase/poly-beta-1,6-N-acetylglucosamine synthase-like glycosyltransferase|nr:glycosyltransferase [Gammaproteobacteria bacterium]
MNKASIAIATAIALLTIALWGLLNRPGYEPPWPSKIQGFSFSPLRAQHDPAEDRLPTVEEIDADLALLQGETYAVRSYTVKMTLGEIPRLAAGHGLNVVVGAWLDKNKEANEKELEKFIQVAKNNPGNIIRLMVGNEAILRADLTVPEMIEYLDRVRAADLKIPISTAEPWHVWIDHPELVDHVDFIAVHLLPYWEGIPLDKAVDYVTERYEQIRKAYPHKPIIIGEVGWPSNGRARKGAEASPANQATFLRRFLAHAEKEKYSYYIMEAFDQPWKRDSEGAIGSYWGVYDVNRNPKFHFTEPIVSVPEWRQLAIISIGVAVLILVLLFRDSTGLKSWGRGFLALVAYSTATVAVWLIYDFTRLYMTVGGLVVGVLLLVAMTGVVVVLLAEAHEWAEALWLRDWRRAPKVRPVPEDQLPMVSIHVPAYNEPPDMLKDTLDALAALDYPRFEVIVIDNNTKDPAVWQPVEAHCQTLGERFRFFHVDPLSGFKAGALNYVLRETHPEAEVVVVIDSDYIVDPRWLRDLIPLYQDPNIAIVQAPQDYRDGEENAFKAMCLAEYRGFFHIGMITRNERNAIIQHGTMTMVRRSVMDELGGWAEWCITEDSELGLRVFEKGLAATYIPKSYGRGLMPDTFVDFKKQRFRWAYGAVMIMRAHLGELLGYRPSALTTGQRYHFVAGWLPWFADGFNLLFNIAAIGWSVAMVVAPKHIEPPMVMFAVLPLVLFVFKVLKMFFLYRRRVEATLRQSIGAAVAGLALSHTIALAMLTGFVTKKIGFFRTPKMANANTVMKAFMDAREETFMLVALLACAWAVLEVQGRDMLDVRVWSAVLAVQSIPYAAALIMSLISAFPKLPATLIGPMGAMSYSEPAQPPKT